MKDRERCTGTPNHDGACSLPGLVQQPTQSSASGCTLPGRRVGSPGTSPIRGGGGVEAGVLVGARDVGQAACSHHPCPPAPPQTPTTAAPMSHVAGRVTAQW